jgi:hypothetical protein
MRAKQGVGYHIVFHPIRRTRLEPGREPLLGVMKGINVTGILTRSWPTSRSGRRLPRITQRAFFPKALDDSNDATVRPKETYVRGRSREPLGASRVAIIHDKRNKRGVSQQPKAAPLQRGHRPFTALLLPFTFHLSRLNRTRSPDEILLTPGVLLDLAP